MVIKDQTMQKRLDSCFSYSVSSAALTDDNCDDYLFFMLAEKMQIGPT